MPQVCHARSHKACVLLNNFHFRAVAGSRQRCENGSPVGIAPNRVATCAQRMKISLKPLSFCDDRRRIIKRGAWRAPGFLSWSLAHEISFIHCFAFF